MKTALNIDEELKTQIDLKINSIRKRELETGVKRHEMTTFSGLVALLLYGYLGGDYSGNYGKEKTNEK
jgi:hypothetical protein